MGCAKWAVTLVTGFPGAPLLQDQPEPVDRVQNTVALFNLHLATGRLKALILSLNRAWADSGTHGSSIGGGSMWLVKCSVKASLSPCLIREPPICGKATLPPGTRYENGVRSCHAAVVNPMP